MSRIARFLVMTSAALMLVSVTGFAQAPPPPAGPRGRDILAGAGLTDAQRDQIRTLRDQDRTAMREQTQQVREAHRALHEEIFADNPNPSKIDALQQQVTSLSQQLQARRLDLQQRIAQILTPEQRRFVREHRGQMRAFRAGRMMERRRMMQQRRPGGF